MGWRKEKEGEGGQRGGGEGRRRGGKEERRRSNNNQREEEEEEEEVKTRRERKELRKGEDINKGEPKYTSILIYYCRHCRPSPAPLVFILAVVSSYY